MVLRPSTSNKTAICVGAISKEKKPQGSSPLPLFARWSMLTTKVLRDWAASLPLPVDLLMRRHRLRFGGTNTGSFDEEAEPGVKATVGNTALAEVLVYGDSEPEAVAGGASEESLLSNDDGASVVGGDSVLCAAALSSTLELRLELSLSSARALPPICSFGTCSLSSHSSMLLRPSRLRVRRKSWNTDWVGEGKNMVVGKSHESIVPCTRSEGSLRRSRRSANGGNPPAGNYQGGCEREIGQHTKDASNEVRGFLRVLEERSLEELRSCWPVQHVVSNKTCGDLSGVNRRVGSFTRQRSTISLKAREYLCTPP